MKRRSLALFLLSTLVLGGLTLGLVKPAEAAYPAADVQSVSQQCTSENSVRAMITWTSSYTGNQWVDLSVNDNGWIPGTFITEGPLPPYQTAFAGNGLTPGSTYFVRITNFVGGVWYSSPTYSFQTLNCNFLAVVAPIQSIAIPILVIVPVRLPVVIFAPQHPGPYLPAHAQPVVNPLPY